jgi:hypothetical protein
MPSGQIVAGNQQVGIGCSQGCRNGFQRCQTAVGKRVFDSGSFRNGMTRRTDGLHRASGVGQRDGQASGGKPTRGRHKQHGGLQLTAHLSPGSLIGSDKIADYREFFNELSAKYCRESLEYRTKLQKASRTAKSGNVPDFTAPILLSAAR